MAYMRPNRAFIPMHGPRVQVSTDASAYWLWFVVQCLLGRIGTVPVAYRWEMDYSCDGSTAGTSGDGVDRWGTTFNASLIPFSAVGDTAHGWAVLKKDVPLPTGGTRTVRLWLDNAGGNAGATGRCRLAMFETITGGTPSTLPTGSLTIGAVPYANFAQTYAADVSNTRRYYGCITDHGEFWFVETILGELSRAVRFDIPAGTKINDQCPFFFYFKDANSNSANEGFPFAGKSIYYGDPANCITTRFYNGGTGYSVISPVNPYALLDAADSSAIDKPAFIDVYNSNTVVTQMNTRGRLLDTGLCGGIATAATAAASRPCNIGQTFRNPLTGLVEYVTLNQLIVPYNDAIT